MKIVRWITALRHRSLAVQLVVLLLAILSAYAGTFFVAIQRGAAGVVAASLAAVVCLASSSVALAMSRGVFGPSNGLGVTILSTIARTVPPLMLALIVRLRGQALVETGFVYYLVGFYLLALIVELPMSLPRTGPMHRHGPRTVRKDFKVHG